MAATLSLAFAGTASAVVVYQDSFTRTGVLTASAPTIRPNGTDVWQQPQGGTYSTNGSTANNAGNFGSIYLPVNGASGVTLNGLADFTLSVDVNASAGPHMGIGLNTTFYAGGNQWAGDNDPHNTLFAALGVSNSGQTTATADFSNGGASSAYTANSNYGIIGNAFGLNQTATLSIAYSATAHTLTYTAGATTIATFTAVPASQIAALTYVSLDNGSFAGNTGTFDNFTLNVAVPEPSTYAMMLGGLGGLALVVRRRLRHN